MLKQYDENKIEVKRLSRISGLVAFFGCALFNLSFTVGGIYATITSLEFLSLDFLGGIMLSLGWLSGAIALGILGVFYMILTKNK